MINKRELKFYRVDNFKGKAAFLVPSCFTLAELIARVKQGEEYQEFEIFLESELIEIEARQLKLEEIVRRKQERKDASPIFYIFEFGSPDLEESQEGLEYYESIRQLLQLETPTKSEWRGANGHVLFEGRNHSLIASSYKECTKLHKPKSIYCVNMQDALSSEELPQTHSHAFSQELQQVKALIATLKQQRSKEELQSGKRYEVNKKFSNFDLNFVTTLEKTYLTYMLRSGCKLTYVEYSEWTFGVIERRLTSEDRIGIIGDYGTGLPDSYQLLENMVIGCGVTVILHLGDVYYAGTPEEYEQHVSSFIRRLRVKTKKEILFYSIPGNHDYYSWGMPFLCFIKEINSEEFTKQKASYFCLRTEDGRWQFLGADTAYHDSNPLDQLNEANVGPRLRNRELAWHKEKLENFEGSTIFLTHHQLYSIHDRLCGSLSKYRHFSCINPVLSKQLFEYMPYFSAWYWGHQHAFMLYRQHFWGVPLCRLLGNSSFHVLYEKEHPYHRKQNFPQIPFIAEDEVYLKKYLPLNPQRSQEFYFNLCFGVIDLKQAQENLLIEYYCSPSYSESLKKKSYFKFYKLYEEVIEGKNSIIKKAEIIRALKGYYLKNEIGLLFDFIDQKCELNLKGIQIKICPTKQEGEAEIQSQMPVYLMIDQEIPLFLTSFNSEVLLQRDPSPLSVWTFRKTFVMHDSSMKITTLNAFSIRNEGEMKYLAFSLSNGTPSLRLSPHETLWSLLAKGQVISA